MHFGGSAVIVVSLLFACSQSASLIDNRNVPLAIITSNSIEFAPAKVGSLISADFLSQTTFAAISENVEKIVFVVLPKLSFPRLVFDANYNNKQDTQFLSHALETMSSTVYPAVSNVELLFGGAMTTLHVKSPESMRDEEILNGGRKTQIRLDPTVSLHDADAIFGQVIKLLTMSGRSFAVIYTADEPDEWISGIPPSKEHDAELRAVKAEVLARYKRQANKKLAATKTKTAAKAVSLGKSTMEKSNFTIIMYGDNCFMFYAKEIILTVRNTTIPKAIVSATLPPIYRKAESSDFNCTTETKKREGFNFTIDYGDLGEALGNFTDLDVTFGLKMKNAWEWHVDAVTIAYKTNIEGLNDGEVIFRPGSWLTAQVLFSYHCNVPEVTKVTEPARALKAELIFKTIQAQVYDIKSKKFGWQCDCVGFFTSAIWAGLVVSVIYLLIIALAMVMLMNLETMDRFEDPKGHGLKIQANG